MKTNVKCPICGNPVSEEFISQFEQSIKTDLENEYQRKQNDLSIKLEKERAEIRKQIQNETHLKIKEKDKLVSDLKDQLFKVNQKLENSSQQLVGEVQELELEEILSKNFSSSIVQPVAKGISGADCQMYIRTKNEVQIGTILFESKRVATFNERFIDVLKKNNLQTKCDLMVIVTSTMPKDAPGKIYLKDGVWICLFEPETIKQMVLILSYGLLKVYEVKQNQNLSRTQSEKLFNYLCSPEFASLFEQVLKGYSVLDQSFQDEKKKLMAYWKIREAQLQEMLHNTLELYNSMKTISPEIQSISNLDFNFRQAS